MFVVAMTLAVLSTIGAWALQSAALEVRMAGYERQSTQTHYLAEYGVMDAMQDLSPGTAQAVVQGAMCGVPTANGVVHAACVSVPCVDFTQFPVASTCSEVTVPGTVHSVKPVAGTCWRWEANAMGGGFPVATTMNPIDGADGGVSGAPGSLGATNTQGSFSAEVTEVGQGPAPSGFSQSSTPGAPTFYWAMVTSYGRTSTAGSNSSEGDEQLRARLEVGPLSIVMGSCQ